MRHAWSGMGLLGDLRGALRVRHYSPRTEEVYVGWVRRFVRANGVRHPAELGPREVGAFLSELAVRGNVSASTQMQALAALLFLYREILGRDLGMLHGGGAARKTQRVAVVPA